MKQLSAMMQGKLKYRGWWLLPILTLGDEPPTQKLQYEMGPNVAYSSGPNSSGIFSCTFSNLSPGTTYYVRAFATNGFVTG